MKRKIIYFLLLGVMYSVSAQDAYFSAGRNFTTYDYLNSFGASNSNIKGGTGSFYEMGVILGLYDNIGVALGVTLSELNATGGTLVDNYTWDTNYLGLQGVLKYKVVGGISRTNRNKGFSMYLNAGINFNTLINGQQKINGQTFDLTKSIEFNGFFIQPLVGIDLNYAVTDNLSFGLGYNFSKNYRSAKSGDESLKMNNNQLRFNLLMSLY
jgi:opacity protein-like surface antigen